MLHIDTLRNTFESFLYHLIYGSNCNIVRYTSGKIAIYNTNEKILIIEHGVVEASYRNYITLIMREYQLDIFNVKKIIKSFLEKSLNFNIKNVIIVTYF